MTLQQIGQYYPDCYIKQGQVKHDPLIQLHGYEASLDQSEDTSLATILGLLINQLIGVHKKKVLEVGPASVARYDNSLRVVLDTTVEGDSFRNSFGESDAIWERRKPTKSNNNDNRLAVLTFRRLAAMPPEGSMRAEILPGYPSLYRSS
ncbi:hypothetical protein T265_06657 [Opisthorchis viverrini]|uniref:Uncharacterized protein n=1 Tax=Opisthorchis viverrini TaxID=6198 RepID=A0A074ZJR3_OPIVI|nr:hypothetical protein T265_06657 [Opisthorchis viverrini]KER26022.1 hypothetical protein T265_06657 [Opisthorchis viverrini]